MSYKKSQTTDWCAAVSQDLEQLAVLHDREADETLISALREVDFPYNLGFPVITAQQPIASDAKITKAKISMTKLLEPQRFVKTALNELPRTIDQTTVDKLASDYANIYLTHSLHASPYESVWLDEDHLVQQEPMFQVREWFKRYGLGSEDWRIRSDDHLVLQLQFIAFLLNPETDHKHTQKKRNEDAAVFMDEHLMLWLADFSHLVMQRCATDFYASIAVLTYAYMDQLRDALVDITGVARLTADEVRKKLAGQHIVEEPISFMPGVAESW